MTRLSCNGEYAFGKWRYLLADAGIEDTLGSQYQIETARGDPFPFNHLYNSRKDASFDLVVATDKCSTAMELLEDFDLVFARRRGMAASFPFPILI